MGDITRAERPQRQFSIGWHLAVLAAAVIIPAVLFGALMIELYAAGERNRILQEAGQRAQALMEAIDRDLAVVTAQITVLSQSDSLMRNDLKAFHQRANRAMSEIGYHLVLFDSSGQQVVNTRLPYGVPLPRTATPALVAEAARTGKPVISDAFTGAVAKTLIYSVYVPVIADGKAIYVLAASLPLTRISGIIQAQNLPDQWSAAVSDSQRVLLARRYDNDKFVGKKGQPLPPVEAGHGGIYRGVNVAGVNVVVPYYRSKLSGWVTGVGVPVSLLEAPVWQLLWPLFALAVLLSAVAAAFVIIIGKRTADALKALVAYAGAAGETPPAFATPVTEVNDAGTLINTAWRELAATKQALQSSDDLLRQALSIGRSYAFQWRADTDAVTRIGAEQVLGIPLPPTMSAFLSQVHPDDRERLKAAYASPIDQPNYQVEFRFQRPDGEWIWLSEHGLNLFNTNGRLEQQTGIVAEFTERKRGERELARIAKSLRRALSVGKSYVYELDLTTGVSRRTGHEEVIGPLDDDTGDAFLARVHPDDRQAHVEAMARATPAQPLWTSDFRFTAKDGRDLWLRVSAELVFDESGHPIKQIGIVTDITEQRIAEAAIQRSEARLKRALSIGRAYVYDYDLTTGTISRTGETEVIGEIAGRPRALLDRVHPDDRAAFASRTNRMTPSNPSLEFEFRLFAADGRLLCLRENSEMIFDSNGKPIRHIGIVTDITESKKASEALQESQALLQLAADAAGVGTFDYDIETRTATWSAKMKQLVGVAPDEPPPEKVVEELAHPDERMELRKAIRNCLDPRGNGIFDNTYRIMRKNDGQIRWLLVRGSTVFSEGDTGEKRPLRHLGIAVDVTEAREAEETRKLLVKELSHRVKNTLATVQAIASQTSRRASNKEEFVKTFTDRLQSLARAHTLLTQSNWQGSEIGDIVREQLTFAGNDNRIVLDGPHVRLSAQYSLQMALVLHELGTNARKHGSLKVEKGKLEVTWRVIHKAGRRWLALDWQESGGPQVKPPETKGFGTLLFERSFSSVGEAEIVYRTEGLVCKIHLPLEPAIEADSQAA